jgi:hypothetical protein
VGRHQYEKGKRKRDFAFCHYPMLQTQTSAKCGNRIFIIIEYPVKTTYLLPISSIRVERPITDRFVDDNVAITDLDVVQARGICTNPRLILDGSSLATEIRKRNQITFTTLATPRKCILHEIASFLLTRDSIRRPDQSW